MSLIDEALKRARLEAAQRAAESEGLPYPTIPRHLAPPHRRRRWLAPAVVALAVIAGLVVGLLVASRAGSRPESVAAVGVGAEPLTSGPATPAEVQRDPPADTPDPAESNGSAARGPRLSEPAPIEPAPPEAPPAARPVTSGPSGPAELVRDPVAPKATEPKPTESAPAESIAEPRAAGPRPDEPPPTEAPAGGGDAPPAPPSPSAQTGTPSGPTVEPAPPPVEPSATAPARQTAPPPEPPATASTVTDPDSGVLLVLPGRPEQEPAADAARPEPAMPIESHVQRFPLPGGGAIELGGIAWSETGPFALINGRVVGPGSAFGDYILERIQQGHVELVGDGRRVHLSLQ